MEKKMNKRKTEDISKLIKAAEKSIEELERSEQEAKENKLNRDVLKEAFTTKEN